MRDGEEFRVRGKCCLAHAARNSILGETCNGTIDLNMLRILWTTVLIVLAATMPLPAQEGDSLFDAEGRLPRESDTDTDASPVETAEILRRVPFTRGSSFPMLRW